jgi:protein SCO1/2
VTSPSTPADGGSEHAGDDRPLRPAPEPRPGAGPGIGWIAALIAVTALVLGIGAVMAVQGSDGGGGDDAATGDDPDEGWNGALLAEPTPRPAFTLTDTAGRPYDFSAETQGRLTLLFFGYTSCPDVCPIHMATLSAALEQPGMPDPIVVFVTTDPERDTPERLRDWLDNFGTDFVGLTGTPEQIAAAEDAAGVARSLVAPTEGDSGSDPGEYEVGHAAQIIAYTPDDLSHVQYPFGVRRQDWQADLPRMMSTWDGRADAQTDAGETAGAADITVGEAWAAADDTISAIYLTIDNVGDDDRLIAAASDVAGRVSVMGPGVAMPADGETEAGTAVDLDIPTGATGLDPGGTHMMLEQLTRPLVAGEQIIVRLTFAEAGEVEVPVDILDWDQVAERAAER